MNSEHQEKIQAFINLRIHEATQKEIPRKARLVAIIMGEQFMNQESIYSGFDVNDIPEESEQDYEGMILDLKYEESMPESTGIYIYDSISNGNIKVRYDVSKKDLTVEKDCVIVFKETEGVISSYSPSPHWEVILNNLTRVAEMKLGIKKEHDLKVETVARDGFLKKTMDYLTQTWGY